MPWYTKWQIAINASREHDAAVLSVIAEDQHLRIPKPQARVRVPAGVPPLHTVNRLGQGFGPIMTLAPKTAICPLSLFKPLVFKLFPNDPLKIKPEYSFLHARKILFVLVDFLRLDVEHETITLFHWRTCD